jgi:hypothetical protein
MKLGTRLIVAAGCACVAPVAAVRAQVTLYYTQVNASYEQTADDTPPSEAYAWAWFAGLHTTARPDSETARVIGGPANPPVELVRGEPDSAIYSAFGGYYNTEAELYAAYPEGEYTFRIDGGTLGSERGTLQMSSTVMATTVPYFTGDTFGRLHALDPFSDFSGTVAPFEVPVDATVGSTQVLIYRTSGRRMGAFETSMDARSSDFVIPANTLRNGRPYQVVVSYTTSRDLVGDFPRDVSTSSAAFVRGSTFLIDVGCPADYNSDGQVDFFDYLDFANAFSRDC